MMEEKKKEILINVCEKYRKTGLSCVESVIRTMADYYNVNLSEQMLQATCAFAGGAAGDDRCGALEAGVAILTLLYYDERIQSNKKIEQLLQELQEEFKKNLGSLLCSELFYPVYEEYMRTHETEDDFHCVFYEGVISNIQYLDTHVDRETKMIWKKNMSFHACSDDILREMEKHFMISIPKNIKNLVHSYGSGNGIGGRCAALQVGYLMGGLFWGRTHGNEPRDRLRTYNKKLYQTFCDEIGMTECSVICDKENIGMCNEEVRRKMLQIVIQTLEMERQENG